MSTYYGVSVRLKLNVKALVGTFNQEKVHVEAFSVIVKLRVIFGNLRSSSSPQSFSSWRFIIQGRLQKWSGLKYDPDSPLISMMFRIFSTFAQKPSPVKMINLPEMKIFVRYFQHLRERVKLS